MWFLSPESRAGGFDAGPLREVTGRRRRGGVKGNASFWRRLDGFAEQGFARLDELARAALDHLEACECEAGCPSCVGLPILRPAQQQDPDLGHPRGIPGKDAARALLAHWLEQPVKDAR